MINIDFLIFVFFDRYVWIGFCLDLIYCIIWLKNFCCFKFKLVISFKYWLLGNLIEFCLFSCFVDGILILFFILYFFCLIGFFGLKWINVLELIVFLYLLFVLVCWVLGVNLLYVFVKLFCVICFVCLSILVLCLYCLIFLVKKIFFWLNDCLKFWCLYRRLEVLFCYGVNSISFFL